MPSDDGDEKVFDKQMVEMVSPTKSQITERTDTQSTNAMLYERAQIAKQRLADAREKITEGVSELSQRLKAYIGTVDDAESYMKDNKYITRGYRVNHNTCRSLFKSLFTCHNESVNVWSHIAGVIVFLTLMVVACVEVMPN